MNASQMQVLSRFFDGEAVDPALLAESLADPEAATYLAQCAALRAWVRDDDARPSDGFYERMNRALKSADWHRAFWTRLARPAVAAGLLLVGGAVGYEYRSRVRSPHAGSVLQLDSASVRQSVPVPNTQLRFALWRESEPGGEEH